MPSPSPTPAAQYTLYATDQRSLDATYVATVGQSFLRRLQTDDIDACYVACSMAGYATPFYINVQTATGACYW